MKFSENVILIDVSFLNEMVCNVKDFFGMRLGRELPNIDLPAWLTYLSLDAGLREENHEIQILLVRDAASDNLLCCEPSDLKQLDGMACSTPLGEFLFSAVSAEDFVSSEQLYLELMTLLLDSKDVKRLLLVPFHAVYGDKVEDALRKSLLGKSEEECGKAYYFAMEEPSQPLPCKWDFVIYSLAHTFGIKSDEL